MNGVTRRMGTNQHLARSIMTIREQGGLPLADGVAEIAPYAAECGVRLAHRVDCPVENLHLDGARIPGGVRGAPESTQFR
jgi:hypothetical protein